MTLLCIISKDWVKERKLPLLHANHLWQHKFLKRYVDLSTTSLKNSLSLQRCIHCLCHWCRRTGLHASLLSIPSAPALGRSVCYYASVLNERCPCPSLFSYKNFFVVSGHFTSSTRLTQHLHSTSPSGLAPMYGHPSMINNLHPLTAKSSFWECFPL